MTDSMNFGPDWIRNLSSDGTTGGGSSTGTRYQLADYRYGREEMLVLFDKHIKAPSSLTNFKGLYSETALLPLALISPADEERAWQARPAGPPGPTRGRGSSLERGRSSRGRGGYQSYGRPAGYDAGWGNGDQTEWSPRKEFNPRNMPSENWRRTGRSGEDEEGWRSVPSSRSSQEKWTRSTSWRGEGDSEERSGPPERGGRLSWHDGRGAPSRKSWDTEDHLPEWATENPVERRGTFDERGAFHGSDDELLDGKGKRDTALQKSTSQQHITNRPQQTQLASSKSAMNLVKKDDSQSKEDFSKGSEELLDSSSENGSLDRKPAIPKGLDRIEHEMPPEKVLDDVGKIEKLTNGPNQDVSTKKFEREDEEFERLQEDLVTKLMVDEEPPKIINTAQYDGVNVQQQPPPPNLVDKWYYQDPQGQMQGPFLSLEMAEWYKAGYFSNQLKIRRDCDERFFLLGELVTLSGGANPFQANVRFPVLKNDVSKVEQEFIQMRIMQQLAAFKESQARAAMAEPWSAMSMQPPDLATQRLLMSQEPHYMPQPPATNPLMHMINQMQQHQANKINVPSMGDKSSTSLPNSLDPHLQMQLLMQNRLSNHLPGGLPTNMPGAMPPESLSTALPTMQSASLPTLQTMQQMPGVIPSAIASTMNIRPPTHQPVDQMPPTQENNPFTNLLKQFNQIPKEPDTLWQQTFLNANPPPAPAPNWQQQPEAPISMWDMPKPNISPPTVPTEQPTPTPQNIPQIPSEPKAIDKEQKRSKEDTAKELKKKRELEEKQSKKEAEERRKQEQRKLEADKRAADEKKRKEEDRIRKELEKARKEAEDKRMRELEEKRRLKEQRKIDEEAKKKSDETKKQEEDKIKRELREQEERRKMEEKKVSQEQPRNAAKAAPWIQANSTMGMSLAEIQKAEREKRAQEAALQVQRQLLQEQMQQQQQEKPTGIQLSWAKNPVEPRKVKSVAEIQAEEQERLAKQAAEARLNKEKEPQPVVNTGSIWNSQTLTWASAPTTTSQWSSNTGFWEESPQKPASKPSTVSKSNSTSVISNAKAPPTQKPVKGKTKKEEPPQQCSAAKSNHNNNNGPNYDEFTNWCYKSLSSISTNVVDVPTFVTFLRDIESALDVKEYCKDYLGESAAIQQFAHNFIEKRRSYKQKSNARKDDGSPAPVTSYLPHSNEFQEVKGKNKKNKKSKMLKVDSRILGFNVTSAPDRINVGDRDYGDNS